MSVVSESPTLEILAREPEGFSIWNGPPFNNSLPHVKLGRVPCTNAKYSENGSRLMVIKSTSAISIYDCRTSTEIRSFEIPSLLAAVLSPCGTYLQTFQKSSTPQDKNVVLWDIETGHTVFNQFQKNMSKTTWPSFHFCSDESISCRMATNEIQFFDGKDFSKGITFRLRVPGIAALELSKSPGSYVAAFVPESKGIPASVQIFSCEAQSQPVARKSFFRCSTVQLHWNYGSTGLLVVAQSDVDKTNQSYYGESKLNYLTTDGSHEGLVSLRKEGPVHDVQWSSSGLEFAVVYGFMPAKATVFDKKCNPLLELGTGPYNTIRWNPKGRFICLAGFGNLPGDMAFWDFVGKKMIGATKAECSVTSEWSPDGRYFMTATTAPRLQIDNKIRIFHHNGSLYFEKEFDKLYQADWKPESAQRFRDITDLVNSVSSLKIEETGRQAQDPKTSSASTKAPVNVIQKPAAYRPPHAKGVAAAKAELFGESASSEQLSKNALRNKKRREKKKAGEGAAAEDN